MTQVSIGRRHVEDDDPDEWCPPLDRRAAIRLMGLGALGAIAGCTTSSASPTSPSTSSPGCGLTFEGEEGPFFVNDSASGYLRTNLLSNIDGSNVQPGIPLALTITVLDARNNCAPPQGVQVDIWACNASGVYSGEASEGTPTESWLRGYQITDASGKVSFNTIVPGWYSGRTTHIHLRLRSTYDAASTGGTNTTQLFFDQALVNSIYTSVAPYSARGVNPTSDATDRVFAQEEHSTNIVSLTGSTAGYAGAITLYVPVTAA